MLKQCVLRLYSYIFLFSVYVCELNKIHSYKIILLREIILHANFFFIIQNRAYKPIHNRAIADRILSLSEQ